MTNIVISPPKGFCTNCNSGFLPIIPLSSPNNVEYIPPPTSSNVLIKFCPIACMYSSNWGTPVELTMSL